MEYGLATEARRTRPSAYADAGATVATHTDPEDRPHDRLPDRGRTAEPHGGPLAADATAAAEHVFRVLRETGTISASGTVQVNERLPALQPGEADKLVGLIFPNAWKRQVRVDTVGLSASTASPSWGTPAPEAVPGASPPSSSSTRDITTVVHVHSPHLGAYAQAHRAFPIRYVALQRHVVVTELPVYVDRRQAEVDFILEQLAHDPDLPAIVEANGGATVWGRGGLAATAELIQLLEEAAQLQVLAEAAGRPQDYGPGVLAQQWGHTGLLDTARRQGPPAMTDPIATPTSHPTHRGATPVMSTTTRRRWLPVALLLLAVSLLAAACGGDDADDASSDGGAATTVAATPTSARLRGHDGGDAPPTSRSPSSCWTRATPGSSPTPRRPACSSSASRRWTPSSSGSTAPRPSAPTSTR